MPSNFSYFYKLGHQPTLGINEYLTQSKNANYGCNNDYLLSDFLIDVNKTGSLVFAGQILGKIAKIDAGKKFYQELEICLRKMQIKQIGISVPKSFNLKQVLGLAKESGIKKVNVINHLPNYGHWKQTKNWIVIFEYEGEIIFTQLLTYFDQQRWANIDSKMPHIDMKRGVINLKLARTLLNFTDKNTIWDPFCGQGRILQAGIDSKSNFLASDIEESCLPECEENFNWTHTFFENKQVTQLANLTQTFALDATKLAQVSLNESLDWQDVAIVTEGYLGTNFTTTPNKKDIEASFLHQQNMWTQTFKQIEKLKIPEIIFCLPFYQVQKQTFYPSFYESMLQNSNYELANFGDKKHLKYSRPDSFVGHFVLKAVRKV